MRVSWIRYKLSGGLCSRRGETSDRDCELSCLGIYKPRYQAEIFDHSSLFVECLPPRPPACDAIHDGAVSRIALVKSKPQIRCQLHAPLVVECANKYGRSGAEIFERVVLTNPLVLASASSNLDN